MPMENKSYKITSEMIASWNDMSKVSIVKFG